MARTAALVVVLAVVAGAQCAKSGREDDVPLDRSKHGATALAFTNALVAGKYDEAHEMLHPFLARELTASDLRKNFMEMIDYGDGPPNQVIVMTGATDWPDKKSGDTGWAYVSISGPGYVEGVAVVVTRDSVIRDIEWGRP